MSLNKISELLVRLRTLNAYDPMDFGHDLSKHAEILKSVTNGKINTVELLYSLDRLCYNYNLVKDAVRREILSLEPEYYRKSSEKWEIAKWFDAADYASKMVSPISNDAADYIAQRIAKYVSWQYPAAQIRPIAFPLSQYITACDPFYLVDLSETLTKPVVETFHPDYQRRLRQTTMRPNPPFFDSLPNNQFGLVVAVGYYEQVPEAVIKQAIREMKDKLRPGGTFCLTINDCDRYVATLHAEAGCAAYTPGHRIKDYADSLGFKITHLDITDSTSWIELTKEGELSSLRGGQCLAKILDDHTDTFYN